MAEEVTISYIQIKACPLCNGEGQSVGKLCRGHYRFGKILVRYPETGIIPLKLCQKCGLVYKEWLPNRMDLLGFFNKWNPPSWSSKSSSSTLEATLAMQFRPQLDLIDILDIGGSNGSALAPLANEPGRKSVLDIIEYPGVNKVISGELILGFAEDELKWSSIPYDVVLAFDLVEHLYNPMKALDNIAQLTAENGVFIVQTADVARVLSENQSTLDDWWYLNLFEHHIAWSYATLAGEMKTRGFVPVHVEYGSHKHWNHEGFMKKQIVVLLKYIQEVYFARKLVEGLLSIDPRQLSDPRKADHMTIVFRKERQNKLNIETAISAASLHQL
jgi:2-polyprenyl-3-methyl-5-hydroxy-6-metoxy-1,4-benzoquinol methylase